MSLSLQLPFRPLLFLALISTVSIDVTTAKSVGLWDKPTSDIMDDIVKHKHPLIVISFDGFRWNYLERTNTPNFDKFLSNGVTAKLGLKNAFVTKTFPNHFTLATGLWEESHGIIANDMFDPDLNQTFSPSNVSANEDPAWFNVGAEPIWVTNQLQNPSGRSGIIMWVGGGAPIKGIKPSRFEPYNASIKNETKIDTLLSWFKDKIPINLGMIYFDQPDGFGHKYGPESLQVTHMIRGLDEVVGYLLKKLEENELLDKMNIIITSDHGFTETPSDKMINLDDYIDNNTYILTAPSPIANIWPHEDKAEEIYQNLTAGSKVFGHFSVYYRDEVPPYFHYTDNRRIPPILAVANDKYSFCRGNCKQYERGDHGYDNRLQDMHPFFLAMGPSFKKNFSVDTFDNVDVYPLMCYLLGINPAPNNGSLKTVSQLLVDKKQTNFELTIVTYAVSAVFITLVGGVFAACACLNLCSRSKTKNGTYAIISSGPCKESFLENNGKIYVPGTGEKRFQSNYGSSSIPLLQDQENDITQCQITH